MIYLWAALVGVFCAWPLWLLVIESDRRDRLEASRVAVAYSTVSVAVVVGLIAIAH